MPNDNTKLLYIAGWDRSGSTILDQILGQLEGFFTVGELGAIWDRGPDCLCGCGNILRNCETWRRIFIEAFGVGPDHFDFYAARRNRPCWARFRHLWLLANPPLRRLFQQSLEPHLELTKKLYLAVSRVTGARVIVDSSKRPTHAYLLQLSGIGVPYIVHLVRDPRGCAYSYQIRKPHPDPRIGLMPTMHPAKSSLQWIGSNLAFRLLWGDSCSRYMLVRYEDFIAQPQDTIRRILEFVGEPAHRLPFVSPNSVSLQSLHGVFGNPSRFHTGVVQLKLDQRWKSQMKQKDKLAVTVLTSPWLSTYGYALHSNGVTRTCTKALNEDKPQGRRCEPLL